MTAHAVTTRDRLAWLRSFWAPHWRFAVGLLLLTLLSSALAILYPLGFRWAINSIEAGSLGERLYSIEGFFALILVGRLVVGFYPGFRAWMNNIIEKAVREREKMPDRRKGYTQIQCRRPQGLSAYRRI